MFIQDPDIQLLCFLEVNLIALQVVLYDESIYSRVVHDTFVVHSELWLLEVLHLPSDPGLDVYDLNRTT